MFVKNKNPTKCIDYKSLDMSIHDGIPKNYYYLKNKNFLDWEIPPWELYIYEDIKLGEGSFSTVYLAKWRETLVVAKVINKEIFIEKKFLVLREFDIMTKLHHPNIVQFLGYVNEPFIIVMEYITNGDLKKNIYKLNFKKKKSIMKDILKALVYIHNRKPNSLIHRDIKPSNILLTNSLTAKITDFGLSKFYNIEKINSHENLVEFDKSNDLYNNDLTNNVGTQRYMAPEILDKNKNYNNNIDIYSLGILLYEMFENKSFVSKSKMEWFWTNKKIKKIIINNMIKDNPDERSDAITLLRLLE